jgi:Universal stress protein family
MLEVERTRSSASFAVVAEPPRALGGLPISRAASRACGLFEDVRMRTLLGPIDGSACSIRALDHAIVLAKERGDFDLHLLNVHPDPIVYGEIQVYETTQRMLEQQRKRAEALLAPAAEKARAVAVPCRADVEIGDAAIVILRGPTRSIATGSSWERAGWARSPISSWVRGRQGRAPCEGAVTLVK